MARIPVSVQTPLEVVAKLPPPAAEPTENIEAAIELSHAYVDGQISAATGLDTKIIGMLAFYAAAMAPVLAVLTSVNGVAPWQRAALWVVFVALGIAGVACMFGVVVPGDLDAGPYPAVFYDDYGGNTPVDYLEQMLSDLDATIAGNRAGLRQRGLALTISILAFAAGPPVALIVGGLVAV